MLNVTVTSNKTKLKHSEFKIHSSSLVAQTHFLDSTNFFCFNLGGNVTWYTHFTFENVSEATRSRLTLLYVISTILLRVIALSELPIIRILTDTQANKGINANVCQECDLFKGDVTIPHRSFIFIVPANCISYKDLTFNARPFAPPTSRLPAFTISFICRKTSYLLLLMCKCVIFRYWIAKWKKNIRIFYPRNAMARKHLTNPCIRNKHDKSISSSLIEGY